MVPPKDLKQKLPKQTERFESFHSPFKLSKWLFLVIFKLFKCTNQKLDNCFRRYLVEGVPLLLPEHSRPRRLVHNDSQRTSFWAREIVKRYSKSPQYYAFNSLYKRVNMYQVLLCKFDRLRIRAQIDFKLSIRFIIDPSFNNVWLYLLKLREWIWPYKGIHRKDQFV